MLPAVLRAAPAALVVAATAAALLSWGRLPAHRRRALSLALSAMGVLSLVFALGAEGHREAETTAQFLLGSGYVTGHALASVSLPYYVVTAVCLLLGTATLAISDEIARRVDRHWLIAAVVVSVIVTAVRFSLERVVAPSSWSMAVGVTWLAPIVGAVFLARLRQEGRGWGALALYLTAYGLLVRGAVAALMVVATRFRLGTHYDVTALYRVRMPYSGRVYTFEPGSWAQLMNVAVIPQLTFWVCYTLLAGLLGAAVYALVTGAARLGLRESRKVAPQAR
jgi:hypothetical protein